MLFHVHLASPSGPVSIAPVASAEELGLKQGDTVTAIIKEGSDDSELTPPC